VLPDPKTKVKKEDFTLKLNKTDWIKVNSMNRGTLNGLQIGGSKGVITIRPPRWPTPSRPIARLGIGCPLGVFGIFSYSFLVIFFFNIVPLIIEFTLRNLSLLPTELECLRQTFSSFVPPRFRQEVVIWMKSLFQQKGFGN
jgi:hypothetical protein